MIDIKVPANLQPYVDILGAELAAEFFLNFGGSSIYLARNPRGTSQVANCIGRDKAIELAEYFDCTEIKVPIAKFWLAKYYLDVKGYTKSKTARTIRVDETTIRKWFSPKSPSNQLSLFD